MKDGACLPLLGHEIAVRVVSGANRVRWDGGDLVLEARPDADCDALARRALKLRAQSLFTERVEAYAQRLGRPVPRLGLSSARTRWAVAAKRAASASTGGSSTCRSR